MNKHISIIDKYHFASEVKTRYLCFTPNDNLHKKVLGHSLYFGGVDFIEFQMWGNTTLN